MQTEIRLVNSVVKSELFKKIDGAMTAGLWCIVKVTATVYILALLFQGLKWWWGV